MLKGCMLCQKRLCDRTTEWQQWHDRSLATCAKAEVILSNSLDIFFLPFPFSFFRPTCEERSVNTSRPRSAMKHIFAPKKIEAHVDVLHVLLRRQQDGSFLTQISSPQWGGLGKLPMRKGHAFCYAYGASIGWDFFCTQDDLASFHFLTWLVHKTGDCPICPKGHPAGLL